MINDEIKNIIEFGKLMNCVDGLYEEEKENSLYTIIEEKGFSKEKEKNKDEITKPLVIDKGFILYNKIKKYILEKYKENGENYKMMFGEKNKKIDLKDITLKHNDIEILSESYVKEIYGKEYFQNILLNIKSKLPNDIGINILNQPSGYGDIKLYIKEKAKILEIKKEKKGEENNIEKIKKNIIIQSWYFYWYFIDLDTNEVKTFFNDDEIKPIIEQLANDNILLLKKDTLTKQEYIFLGNLKFPVFNKIEKQEVEEIKNNYFVGKEIIENIFTIEWYGVKIEIIPTNLNKILLKKEQISYFFKILNEAILRYNEGEIKNRENKDIKISSKFNLFSFLYNIYKDFQQNLNNDDISNEVGFLLNTIPFSFIFKEKEYNSTIFNINGISLSKINDIIEQLKINLGKYDKYKNIEGKQVIEKINRLLYKDVVFSNYTNNDGYSPKNEFLLKIKFINYLLLGNLDKVNLMLKNIPDFIKKEKRKHYNGTSRSNGYLAKWEIYNLTQDFLGNKTNLSNKDFFILRDKLYEKNKKIIKIIKEALKINPKFLEQFIVKLRNYNKEKIKEFLMRKLIFYTAIDSKIRLKGKQTILNDIVNNLEIQDILYIIQYILYTQNEEIENKENNKYGFFYDKNKKNLLSKFVNTKINTKNKNFMIFEFISKIYINFPNKRKYLQKTIEYFYKNISDIEDIETYILKTLIA